MRGEEGKGCTGKLDIHPCSLGEKKTPCPTLSVPAKPSRAPAGCDAPATQVERRRASGREAAEALAGGQVPSLAGDKPGGVLLSWRAEGSAQPSLSGVGCHQHTKQPAELLAALTQRGSILPNRNWGGQGQGDRTSCALLLARIAAGVSWAAWLPHPTESLPQPRPRVAKASSSRSSSPSRTQPQSILDPANPLWGLSGLRRKGKNYSRDPNIWGFWG